MKAIIDLTNLEKKFYPITKSVPFEMLPLVDRPIIEFFLYELINAGFKNILIVNNRNNKISEDYFDKEIELESIFELEKSQNKLDKLKTIPENICIYSKSINTKIDAKHTIYQLKEYIDDKQFVFMRPRYFFLEKAFEISSLIETGINRRTNVIGVVNSSLIPYRTERILLSSESESKPNKITKIEEENSEDSATNSYSSVKKYFFQPEVVEKIFNCEYQFIEIEEMLAKNNGKFLSENEFLVEKHEGNFLDFYNTAEYIKSFTKYALFREEFKTEYNHYLSEITKT